MSSIRAYLYFAALGDERNGSMAAEAAKPDSCVGEFRKPKRAGKAGAPRPNFMWDRQGFDWPLTGLMELCRDVRVMETNPAAVIPGMKRYQRSNR